jgi:nucleoside-diphosphate-sugar epimerase
MPWVRKYVGFSSGATMHLAGQASFSLQENPYAAQKRLYESKISEIAESLGVDISVARVWSVTGSYVTKPDSFAFTDLISQAKLGQIDIRSNHLIYRRYCSVEDVLAIAMIPEVPGRNTVFDTGGELVELGELAKLIVEIVNPNAEILRQLDSTVRQDNYHSDNKDWGHLTGVAKLPEDTLRDQIARVLT